MQKSEISWTEFTWNPVTGCNKISQGCKNCYAEQIANRFWGDRKFTDVQCHPKRLNQPLKLKKPSMIFVNSMSDLFHEKVPFEFIRQVYDIMLKTQQHKYIILTKRINRAKNFYREMNSLNDFPNTFLGVSISLKKDLYMLGGLNNIYDYNNNILQNKIVSFEPLLENIECDLKGLSWVIIGAESGKNRRPCQIDWIENLMNQSLKKDIPVFVKQIDLNGELLKEIDKFPSLLQIQQKPKGVKNVR